VISRQHHASMKRRDFIRNTTLAASVLAVAPRTIAKEKPSSDKPLRMAFIGIGGRGYGTMMHFIKGLGQELVAICDVDEKVKSQEVFQEFPNIAFYTDYRKMFEEIGDKIDAVQISTPDHSHYAAAMCAIKHGIHMYLEKPMTHTIWQGRELYKAVKENNIVAQMGNQSHSTDGIRHVDAWIKEDFIGKVSEVILWTDRPMGTAPVRWVDGEADYPLPRAEPEGFYWDLWQNVAEPQEYFGAHWNWRDWWKYGSGALGDIGCHLLDIPVFALGLKYPSKITAQSTKDTPISASFQEKVEYYFDKTNQGVPVKLTWHSGFKYPKDQPEDYDKSLLPKLPQAWLDTKRGHEAMADNGMFIIGDKGVIYSPAMHLQEKPVVLPRDLWNEVKDDLPKLTNKIKNGDHYLNFVEAVQGKAELSSDFEYAHVLNEVVQLGNLAIRSKADIVWDSKNLVCKGNPEATKLVKYPMRPNWY